MLLFCNFKISPQIHLWGGSYIKEITQQLQTCWLRPLFSLSLFKSSSGVYFDHNWIKQSEKLPSFLSNAGYLHSFLGTDGRRIIGFGSEGTLTTIQFQCSMDRVATHSIRLSRAPSNLALNTSRDQLPLWTRGHVEYFHQIPSWALENWLIQILVLTGGKESLYFSIFLWLWYCFVGPVQVMCFSFALLHGNIDGWLQHAHFLDRLPILHL